MHLLPSIEHLYGIFNHLGSLEQSTCASAHKEWSQWLAKEITQIGNTLRTNQAEFWVPIWVTNRQGMCEPRQHTRSTDRAGTLCAPVIQGLEASIAASPTPFNRCLLLTDHMNLTSCSLPNSTGNSGQKPQNWLMCFDPLGLWLRQAKFPRNV